MSRFFINRPIVAMVISILLVLGGLLSIRSLPISQYPEIVPPQVIVSATFPGADALTVEQSVATPIEEQINGAKNMLYLQSNNANDGTMRLRVTFDVSSNIDLDNVEVQNRLTQAAPFLPADVRNLGLTVRRSTASPLLLVALTSPTGQYDPAFLGNYGIININDELLRVRGVGDIANFGASQYAMRIWVRPDVLARRGLTVTDLTAALLAQNAVNPAGQIGGEPAPPGQELTFTARAQGRLETEEQFGNIVVRAEPSGALLRLRDVARIELGTQTYTQIARLNGKPAAVIAVYQQPGTNALEVATGVRQKLEELKQQFPPGMEYVISLDTTLPITVGIHEIVITLLEALVLVVLVVFIFLQSWRATLIPMIAVPVSLIGAFIVFPVFGFSINTLSLFGLVLAIGLVVDDAIVVVEAVERHIEEGLSPRDASFKAMEEVTGPVIGIALILSAVFIPIAFLPGISGRLSQQFAVTIAVSVLISAFNALSLSPALCALLLRPGKLHPRGPLGRLFKGFERGFRRTTDTYVWTSQHLVRRALTAVLLVGVVAAGALLLGGRLPSAFIPNEDQGYLFLDVQLPPGASLQRSDAVAREIEGILAKTEGVERFNSIVGFSLLSQVSSSNTAFFFVTLKPWEERKSKALQVEGILKALNARLSQLPEAQAIGFPPSGIPGLGTTGGLDFMLQDRGGNPPEYLAAQLERFLAAARQRPELTRINSTWRTDVPQIFLDVDRDRVLKQGVPLREVYQALQAFLGGIYVNDFNRFGRQWHVYLQAEPEYRASVDALDQLFVRGNSGAMVPVSAVTTPRPILGPQYTIHYNLFRAAEVTGGPAPGYSTGQAMAAMEEVATQVLPAGMGFDWTALSYQERHAGGAGPTFALAIVTVFLVLAALYESWSLPFSVLLGTPVAVLGAFLGLMLRGFPLDVFTQVGLVMMVGLSAKNAILIVEFAVLQKKQGMNDVDAALTAGRLRLRPIVMTSIAFIMGCVPLWIASGAGAVGRRELGTTVIAGMLLSTVLGTLLVPGLFVAVERAMAWRRRRFQPRRGGGQ